MGNYIAHALVLIEQKEPLDELLATATSLDAGSVAERLSAELTALISSRGDTRERYQWFGFALTVLVLFGLTVFFALSRRALSTQALAPAAADHAADSMEETLNLAPNSLDDYDDFPAAMNNAPAGPTAKERKEAIYSEYLLQALRAGSKRLAAHMKLMDAVTADVSRLIVQSSKNLGDGQNTELGLEELKATLGELKGVAGADSAAQLLQAMRRCVQIVDRASLGFHTGMLPLIETERRPIDLGHCVEIALAVTDGLDVQVEKKLVPVAQVNGSADELTGAMSCIITNAVEALEGLDTPGLIRVQTAQGKGSIAVTFTDNGPGMDKKVQQAALAAFYSTRANHQGLGLSAALYVIKKHGGSLQLNSVPGKGTAVRILLPAEGSAPT